MAAYDPIVIGAGTAGSYLAERLARSGMKVAAVERKLVGGTCVNISCTPTKTLVASAYAAHIVRRTSEYGVEIGGPVTVDMKRAMARKDAVVAPRQAGLEAWLRNTENCTASAARCWRRSASSSVSAAALRCRRSQDWTRSIT